MLWMAAGGMLFAMLNTAMKWLAHDLHPWVVGSLRYFFGFVGLTPLVWRPGLAALRTRAPGLTVVRCRTVCGQARTVMTTGRAE